MVVKETFTSISQFFSSKSDFSIRNVFHSLLDNSTIHAFMVKEIDFVSFKKFLFFLFWQWYIILDTHTFMYLVTNHTKYQKKKKENEQSKTKNDLISFNLFDINIFWHNKYFNVPLQIKNDVCDYRSRYIRFFCAWKYLVSVEKKNILNQDSFFFFFSLLYLSYP